MEKEVHKRYNNFEKQIFRLYFFIPTRRELNSLSIILCVVCGYMLCRWTYINWTLNDYNNLNKGPKFF